MGAWGTAIFSDDIAVDTRDAFTDFVAEGLTPPQATDRLIKEFADYLEDEDDAVVFWLSLAATQWKLGRLVAHVRDHAIKIIESEADLRRWEDSSKAEINQRKKHLNKLLAQLFSQPPKSKKIKATAKSSTDFKIGDVADYRLDDHTIVRFCVVNVWGDRGGKYANICLLGLADSRPFRKKSLKLADTLGPQYTMIYHEPADRVILLCRGIGLPEKTPRVFRAWNNLIVRGHACTWDDFPAALREVLPKLGWK